LTQCLLAQYRNLSTGKTNEQLDRPVDKALLSFLDVAFAITQNCITISINFAVLADKSLVQFKFFNHLKLSYQYSQFENARTSCSASHVN
jgi:hypothetical protein